MTRVLLTGANGFLGKELVKVLEKDKSIELVKLVRSAQNFSNVVTCDLTDRESVKSLLDSVSPDVILHTAAFVPKHLSDYESDLSNKNLLMVQNLLAHSDASFINISSMTVYGSADTVIRSETDSTDPQSAYGKSKLEIEDFLSTSKSQSVSIRIPGLFGVNRRSGLLYNTLESLSKDKPLVLPSEPLLWSAMNVADAAESIYKVIKAFIEGRYSSKIINVAYTDTLSINKFVDMCEDMFGKSLFYEVEHPRFAFCTENLRAIDALPSNNFKDSLLKLKADYGF